MGRIVYQIKSDGPVQLSAADFELRVADIMTTAGEARLGGAAVAASSIPRVVHNELAQNHPNPFNPTTTISYSIAKRGHVVVAVYAVDGRRVRTLVDEVQSSDIYRVSWDGTDNRGSKVASGVYFYRISSPQFSATKKMVLLK